MTNEKLEYLIMLAEEKMLQKQPSVFLLHNQH